MLAWLKETGIQVTEESPTALSARPIYKNGNVGPELISLQVRLGSQLPTLVVITVQFNTKPGESNPMIINNPMTIPPIFGLALKVSKADPGWRPAT